MTIFMLSLIGLPPRSVSSESSISPARFWQVGSQALAIIGVLTSLVSSYYYLRVVVTMYMQEGDPEHSAQSFLNLTTAFTAIVTVLVVSFHSIYLPGQAVRC